MSHIQMLHSDISESGIVRIRNNGPFLGALEIYPVEHMTCYRTRIICAIKLNNYTNTSTITVSTNRPPS